MRGRRRVGREGLGVTNIDQTLENLERIIEFDARVVAALDAKAQQGRRPAIGVFLRQPIVFRIRQTGVVDPRRLLVFLQILGHRNCIVHMPLHA